MAEVFFAPNGHSFRSKFCSLMYRLARTPEFDKNPDIIGLFSGLALQWSR